MVDRKPYIYQMFDGFQQAAQLLTNTFVKLLIANTVFANTVFENGCLNTAFQNGFVKRRLRNGWDKYLCCKREDEHVETDFGTGA